MTEVNEEVETIEEATEEPTVDEAVETEELEEGPETEVEVEAWQLSEEEQQEPEPEKKPVNIPLSRLKRERKKVEKRDEQIEELKQKIEAMSAGNPTSSTAPSNMPDRYEYDDEESYQKDSKAYMDSLLDKKLKEAEQQRIAQRHIEEQNQRFERARDEHTQRAEKLISENNIAPEAYVKAEEDFITGVNDVTGSGDTISTALIEALGEGSEKVVYYLGRNKNKLSELKGIMASDPTGLKAVAYLGRLQSQLTKPVKRVSKAPAPAKHASGDATGSSNADALKRKYKAAHKNNKGGDAFKIKREAKKAGIDTKDW